MSDSFDVWYEQAFAAWEETAPSYVQADMRPLKGNLRHLHKEGATVAQFREALEVAFATKYVQKRKALFYAYGIIRRQLGKH